MNLKDSIHKAVLLVDLKNDWQKAVNLLDNSLSDDIDNYEIVDFIRAKVLLGELLFENNRVEESLRHLQDTMEIFAKSDIESDLVEVEIKRAKELIEQII